MLSNRPLFPTLADSRWFVWTKAATDARNSLLIGRNTLLIGPHGSGKTSTLHMTEHSLRERQERPVAFVSLAGLENANEVVLAVHGAAVERNWLQQPTPATLQALADGVDPLAPVRLLRHLRDCPPGALFLVDDVGPSAALALFGRLRDELWQLQLTWAAATLPDDAGPLITPPGDAFFERRVMLGEMDAEERLELLRSRMRQRRERLPSAQVKTLALTGPGNPRQLIELARGAVSGGPPPDALAAAAQRRLATATEAAGRPGGTLVANMEGLGPVSAGDPRLLDRVGWDRPRAARTLSRLERAGVVRSFLEPREGRIGRPRKLYEVVPATDFVPS